MPAYLLTIPESARGVRSAVSQIVFAENEAGAREACKARFNEDSPAAWDAATAVEIEAKPIGTSPNMNGWGLRVAILDSDPIVDLTVRGDSSDDTLDEIATAMAAALNAQVAAISGAAYVAGTNVLTIAAAGDSLGDKTTLIEFYPPLASDPGQSPITVLVLSKVDGGAAGAALTVTFQADTYSLPVVYEQFDESNV